MCRSPEEIFRKLTELLRPDASNHRIFHNFFFSFVSLSQSLFPVTTKRPQHPPKHQPRVRTNQNTKPPPHKRKPENPPEPPCATKKQTAETPRNPAPQNPQNRTFKSCKKHPGNPLLPLNPTILLAQKRGHNRALSVSCDSDLSREVRHTNKRKPLRADTPYCPVLLPIKERRKPQQNKSTNGLRRNRQIPRGTKHPLDS